MTSPTRELFVATPPSGPTLTATSTVTIPLAAFGIVKSASVLSFSAAGTAVTYTYVVTNTGSATLTDVTVTDDVVTESAIDCGGGSNVVASLAGGAIAACTASYTTTAADVTAGEITNTGTAVGTPPTGPNLTATSTVTIPLAAIGIVKSASISSFSAAGTAITYTYVVTNAGGAPLTDVTVTDPMVGLSAIDCGGGSNVVASLAAGVVGDLHRHLHHHRRRCDQ